MTFLLVILGLCAMWEPADALTLGKPVLTGPSVSVLSSVGEFACKLNEFPSDQSILFQLFKEGNLKKVIGHYTAHRKEEAIFPFVVSLKHDGRLTCEASVQNNSGIMPTFSDWLDFQVLVPVEGAHIISSPSSGDLWEGDSLTLQCNITKGTYVSYDWQLNDRLVQVPYNRSHNQLTIRGLSSRDSGKYVCVASNQLNDTHLYTSRSDERDVHVKENLSKPEISFEVVKDKEGNFNAYVTCQLTKGSQPINFTLLGNNHNVGEDVSEHLNASFVVPILLDQDMGTVQCQANNGKRPLLSRQLNLTVESVGGAVTMRLEKAVGQDFEVLGVWLYCSVERGTFPHYYWFLNNTRLKGRAEFSVFRPDHSGLTFSLHPSSAGVWHCEATNSFDNTTRVSSPKTLISQEVLNKIPTEVVAIVFTCFSLLIIAVSVCCIYGVVIRKRQSSKYIIKELTEMDNKVDNAGDDNKNENEEDEYGGGEYDDLDAEAYSEASNIEDFDESEEEEETNFNNGY